MSQTRLTGRRYAQIIRRQDKHNALAGEAQTPEARTDEAMRHLRSVVAMAAGDPVALAAIADRLEACSGDIIADMVGRFMTEEVPHGDHRG